MDIDKDDIMNMLKILAREGRIKVQVNISPAKEGFEWNESTARLMLDSEVFEEVGNVKLIKS